MVAMSRSGNTPATMRHGEVIETSTIGFLAESDRLHRLPQLGELVQARIDDSRTAYAVVSFGQTSGIDPGRQAVRRGQPDSADQDVYNRHPELDHVLRSIFRVAVVGYAAAGSIRHALPPYPVPLHFGVHPCARDDIRTFCQRPEYLAGLLAFNSEVSSDQIVGAHLTWVDQILDDSHVWLESACRILARLMNRDYNRLVILLESVDPDRR